MLYSVAVHVVRRIYPNCFMSLPAYGCIIFVRYDDFKLIDGTITSAIFIASAFYSTATFFKDHISRWCSVDRFVISEVSGPPSSKEKRFANVLYMSVIRELIENRLRYTPEM